MVHFIFWVYFFLFPDPRHLDEENDKKLETLSISWVVVEKLSNHIEIAELPEFFFSLEKIYIFNDLKNLL